jgi:uncharacterized membrane protein
LNVSKDAAEIVMVVLSIICGAGSWLLYSRGYRLISVIVFIAGVAAMDIIARHWDINVNSF